MIAKVLQAATPNLRDLADWAGVSYETARSWRIGRRSPSPDAARKLAKGLRAHARQLNRLADQLERHAARHS